MRVKNFAGFMKGRNRINESEMGMDHMGYMPEEMDEYGANPEEEEAPEGDDLDAEGEEEETEVTLEDLKAMIEDLTERVNKLEGGDEAEEGEEAEGEEAEGEEAEGEEAPEGKEAEEEK
jgi:hypothetical protein